MTKIPLEYSSLTIFGFSHIVEHVLEKCILDGHVFGILEVTEFTF